MYASCYCCRWLVKIVMDGTGFECKYLLVELVISEEIMGPANVRRQVVMGISGWKRQWVQVLLRGSWWGSKVAEPGVGTYVSLSNIQRISGNREY